MTIEQALEKIKEMMATLLGMKKQLSERQIPITELAEALAQFEGFYKSGSVAQRNNNPCNLRWSKFQTIQKGGFAFFNNPETGRNACLRDLSYKCKGKTRTGLGPESTIENLIWVWAPPDDNNETERYANFVCQALGIEKSYRLKNFINLYV